MTRMTEAARTAAYRRMSGTTRLTPRQRRRINHKRNHAAAPFGRKLGPA